MTSAPVRDLAWQPQFGRWPATPQRRARARGRSGRQTRAPRGMRWPPPAQPAIARLNVNEAWCEALFASALQPSDSPTADLVAGAISCAVGQFGVRGRAGRMAQEFGDHSDAAASRMRWVRQLAQTTGGGR